MSYLRCEIKGAVCSSGEEMSMRIKRSSLADFYELQQTKKDQTDLNGQKN